jgi:glycosyltransferase involved in cell wall biosynthesis
MLIHMLTATHPDRDGGGGGLQNQIILRIAENLGHKVNVYTELEQLPGEHPDLYWLSNMCGKFPIDRLTDKVGHTKYMVHDDAYMTLCPQPTREYKLCWQEQEPYGNIDLDIGKATYDSNANTNLPVPITTYNCHSVCHYWDLIPLMANCNIFSSNSPMHSMIWSGIFPSIKDKIIVMDPPINIDKFLNRRTIPPVPNSYIYVGTIAKGKGFDKAVQFVRNRGGEMFAIGDIHHTIDWSEYKDVNYYSHVPYDLVPNIISGVQYLIHLPDWPEPQGRNITEGLLMGCQIIGNRRIGAFTLDCYKDCVHIEEQSHPDYPRDIMVAWVTNMELLRERIYDAPYKYWRDIGVIIGE